jgi:chemotaxis protein CheX
LEKNTISASFIRPFLVETVEVFEVQANTKVIAGTVFKRDAEEALSGDITGVVGIVSDHFVGSVLISFPEQTFLKIVSRVMEKEIPMITKDIIDGAGEFTNMIFSRAKATLNAKGMAVKSALPSIVIGKSHNFSVTSAATRTVIPFDSDAGSFTIEIYLVEQE